MDIRTGVKALLVQLVLVGVLAVILAIALPVLLFAVALALGRRRGLLSLTLFLLTGLAIVAVFWLDVVAYTNTVPTFA